MNLESLIQTRKQLPPRFLLYSIAGWGKSTLAASMPEPIFIDLEDGLAGIKTTALPYVENYKTVEEYLRQLITEDHKYKTVVIDSLSGLEKLINAQVCLDNSVDSIEKIGYGRGRVFAMAYYEKIISGLELLRKKDMTIMLIAHSAVKIFNSPITDSYDKYFLTLHKTAASMITAWSDYIFFGDHKVFVTKNKEGFTEQSKGIGEGKRVIFTEERPAFVSKSRTDLPFEIDIPKKNGWNAIQKHLDKK